MGVRIQAERVMGVETCHGRFIIAQSGNSGILICFVGGSPASLMGFFMGVRVES